MHSSSGLSDTVVLSIDTDNAAPVPVITAPLDCDAPGCWTVGQPITVTGTATDEEDGTLLASQFDWNVIIHHCPAGCHVHNILTKSNVKTFTFNAPDHDYPSYLEIKLTVTDSKGTTGTTSVELQPQTATVNLASSPSGVPLSAGNTTHPASWTATVIKNSETTISGPLTRTIGGARYRFSTWNDTHTRVRTIDASVDRSLTATYVPDATDSCSTATALAKDVWHTDRSSGNEDVDWFEFHLSHRRKVTIRVSDQPISLKASLYKGCSTRLVSVNAPGRNDDVITRTLSAGTYRVAVSAPSNGWSANPYKIRFLRK